MKLDEKEEKYVRGLEEQPLVSTMGLIVPAIACAFIVFLNREQIGMGWLVFIWVILVSDIFLAIVTHWRQKKLLRIIEKLQAPEPGEPNTSPGRGAAATQALEPRG